MFDVETLGIESTTIILSAAIIHFDFADKEVPPSPIRYKEIVDRACYVKFDAKEQGNNYKRTITGETLEWWKKQSDVARNLALNPSKEDVSVVDGIIKLRNYIAAHGGPKQIFWARGSLDQMAIDSLCRAASLEPLTLYNQWRDVRTAVDLIADSSNGYCKVKDFNSDVYVTKHDPREDCALDIMMLLYPN